MSDNEDLLGEDLGDHSLADYNLGNEEEEQLLADDYEGSGSQNVPTSLETYREPAMVPSEYGGHGMEYAQPLVYPLVTESECVVPNITVEVPNVAPPHSTYAPYEPRHYGLEHAVPPAIPAAPIESPQIVPSEVAPAMPDPDITRERFISERPVGAQRMPQIRDIPDSLDKVVIPRSGLRGRSSWRSPHLTARYSHPYRRNNMHRGNFVQRNVFPPPQIRPNVPQIRPEITPQPPEIIRQVRPDIRPIMNPIIIRPEIRPDIRPELIRPDLPPIEVGHFPRFQFERGVFPRYQTPRFPRREPEVRMLPVPPPGPAVPPPGPAGPPPGLAGKKVLINPHFKGNFQPPVDGPIKDIDDAAERFIAEQRNALARAAGRKNIRRSPQRYIENNTIKIENELALRGGASGAASSASGAGRCFEDEELLRRQEEFINANRAGLRRRMRSPSPPPAPPRRSPSPPRRDTDRRPRDKHHDEESEYKRRLREQESLRERVLRAKEVRRRRNALQTHERERQIQEEKEKKEKEVPKEQEKEKEVVIPKEIEKPKSPEQIKPDTTRKSPEKTPENSPDKEKSPKTKDDEVNSTCDGLTPPRGGISDDELDLILGDIDGILSDDEDTGRFKEKTKPETPKPKPVTDLRTKLPPKPATETKKPRQKIVFNEDDNKDKTPPKRPVVTSSTKMDDSEPTEKKIKTNPRNSLATNKSKQRIIFEKKEAKEKEKQQSSNRRVILQRKTGKDKSVFSRIEVTNDPTKPNPGIFSRAVRTLSDVKKNEPQIEYESESDEDTNVNEALGSVASVKNLPHGMTDTRLKTLAGNDVQSLLMDKEDRSAKITFRTSIAAETFKKKFNNKMVAASRLTVTLI